MLLSLCGVGFIVTLYAAYKVIWWAYLTLFKSIDLSKYRKSQSWAVVTGATDGIGLGFAQVLAEHGFNILLVSRNKEKLENVKNEIATKTKVQVDYVVSDATDCSDSNFKNIVDKVSDRDVAILVNNVGVSTGERKAVHACETAGIETSIKVNCLYPTLLSHAMIPTLLRHPGPKLVINLSSVAGLVMAPSSSVYSATKAYNRSFSLAMSADYYQFEMDVLCVEPGYVASSMTKLKPSLICCTPRECAESSLKKVGDLEVIPHWKHMLMYMTVIWYRLLPSKLILPVVCHAAQMLYGKTKKPE